MYSLQQLVVMVVTEKERKIREAFKIMGMKVKKKETQEIVNIIFIYLAYCLIFVLFLGAHSN